MEITDILQRAANDLAQLITESEYLTTVEWLPTQHPSLDVVKSCSPLFYAALISNTADLPDEGQSPPASDSSGDTICEPFWITSSSGDVSTLFS